MKRKQEEGEEEQWQHKKVESSSKYNTHGFGDGLQWSRGPMIGKGRFGCVYLAYFKQPKSTYTYCYLPETMAVKSAEISESGTLQKEKEVLIKLQGCPYVIKCHGEEITTDDNGGMVYNLLLKHASGGDLASMIKKSNNCGLPETDVRRYTRSILQGLKGVHDSGYAHCDLKPANILLACKDFSSKPEATIGDFGSAKRVKQSKKDPYLRGTSMYLSPEAVVNNVQEAPSDIWALGCVVLEILTGKPAWDRSGHDDLLCRIAKAGALPNIPDGIPEDAKSFLKGCFIRKAKSRPTAAKLLNHPFVRGLDEDIDEEEEEEQLEVASNGKEVYSSALLSDEEDSELSDSDCSNDSGYFSEDDSSWSGETVARNIQLFSTSNHRAAIGVQQLTGMKTSIEFRQEHSNWIF